MEKARLLNKFILHPSFMDILRTLSDENIVLPRNASLESLEWGKYSFPTNGKLKALDKVKSLLLNPHKGQHFLGTQKILAYDESIEKFQALEGAAYLTSHSIVIMSEEDYIPSNYLTLNFYTRSETLLSKNKFIKDCRESVPKSNENEELSYFESAYKKDYAEDRTEFILERTPRNSILLIDGPLIGAQMSLYTVKMNEMLLANNVIPLYFVKNSTSNLVTDNIVELKGKFNSDMHWAYSLLKSQERTNFFQYTDQNNASFSKIFCYFKPFNSRSPQRIEMHTSTYQYICEEIDSLMDLICYLVIAHGDINNPQVRPIAIAEQFARKTIKMYDIHKLMELSNIIPSMNEVRFG
ncbi:DNA double-strand break repair nuclease NurA [uncultured Methanomethylovorans sp.]|uniref:DNA double-strand break repair nuclease NurA n=1 Tax=uncultured Methanomethylovorans sp. TaxID=183759 RepID=UPI002AA92399|nr:DNA double-strand break repair nuclease NurA [uncultured Methanomethylovorans sp.]